MSRTTVVHINAGCDVRIDRRTKWGNPFKIGKDGSRADVIAKYRGWILHGAGQHLLDDLHELKGKRLGCHCAPAACHGDVLAELADNLQPVPYFMYEGEPIHVFTSDQFSTGELAAIVSQLMGGDDATERAEDDLG